MLLLIVLSLNCSTTKYIPLEKEEITHQKDSIVYIFKDSVIITPVERVINITFPNQISDLETTLAKSNAYTDSLGFMHHTLENKTNVMKQKETIIQYKEKIDTTYIKIQEPYEVEVPVKYIPKFYKFTFYWFWITLLIVGLTLFLKIRTLLTKSIFT